MMYCQDCGSLFESAVSAKEHLVDHYYQDVECCPNCGSDDIGKAEECELCGEPFGEHEDGASLPVCPECREKIDKALSALADELDNGGVSRDDIFYSINEVLCYDF